MKNWMTFIFIGVVHLIGFSQNDHEKMVISNDIELIRLSKNVYLHVSYSDLPTYGRVSSNGLIYCNGDEAFLFDTPMTDSLTKDLVAWINDSLKMKIVGFVPNHWHSDCMGGLEFLKKKKIRSYANQMTIDIARSKNLPVPEQGFKDSLQLQLGDKVIQCYYPGAAHSLDNIVVWIPDEQILFAGCMVKSLESKNLGNTSDGDLIAYPKTIDQLIEKFPNARIVVPGHGQFGGLDLIMHTKELLKTTR